MNSNFVSQINYIIANYMNAYKILTSDKQLARYAGTQKAILFTYDNCTF